jgi:hypothetical protein
MQEKGYSFVQIRSEVRYEFVSVSAEKEVKKVVVFSPIENQRFYNLALLDTLPNGQLSDITETHNQDMITVLATVIKIVDDFLDANPQIVVLFKGSDERRQRLYRIIIGRELTLIQQKFRVFGGKDNIIEPFRENQPYQFFLISKYNQNEK